MAEKKPSSREQVKQIVKQIENGIQELFQSEKYADYLRTMSRFHTYSYNNQILIHMQMPNATRVAGFNKWKNQFGRHVKKGEKGLTIIAPTPFKKRVEETVLDPNTKEPVTDQDGNIIVEEKVVEIPLFRPVKVFDVSQTDGAPLPSLVSDLTGNVEHYDAFMEALRRTSPVPIEIKPLPEGTDGVFSSKTQSIAIREGMSQIQTVCAGVHEITHATLHNRHRDLMAAAAGDETGEAPKLKDRNTQEVEAESVSYAVCQYFGIETGENSLGYIATWSKNKTLPELKSSMETISKTANLLISGIERHFQDICKERGIELSEQDAASIAAAPAVAPDTPERFVSDFVDFIDGLYQAGIMSLNFPEENREQTKANLAGAVGRKSELFRNLLDQLVSEGKSVESAKALLERLDALSEKPPQVEKGYVYKMEVNAGASGKGNTHFIQEYEKLETGKLKPGEILFVGSAGQCQRLLEGLNDGTIQRGSFVRVNTALVSRYSTHEGVGMVVFEGKDHKIYIGRSDRYDGGGRYDNHDGSLLYLSDNDKMFDLASIYGLSHSSNFTQEDYAEFAALQNGVLAQFVETEPLLFNGKPFSLSPPEPELEQSEPIPQEEAAHDTTLDEYPMPDPDLTVTVLEQRGYIEGDLLPVMHERASELLDRDFTVYAVVDGGKAEIIFDQDDIEAQPADSIFAVPREEWEVSPDFRQAVAERMDRQEAREQAFLGHAGDCFAIYQLRHDDELHGLRYESLDRIRKAGQNPVKGNYELVYTSEIPPEQGLRVLDTMWEKFNTDHPPDYQHPSMSVSDIVALKQDGVVSSYYVDSFGFTALPGFIQDQPMRSAETVVEDSGKKPTVAELEAQVKAGQSISLMDLASAVHRERDKKSVVAQLKEKPQGRERKKAAPKKSAEREV